MDKNKCISCGGAPKCSCKNKDFTKAVVEINNPEQITLMRKVVIPASMGDETTVPPTIGKYRNVILKYEASGKVYLYSSDGIPTSLEMTAEYDNVFDSIVIEYDHDDVTKEEGLEPYLYLTGKWSGATMSQIQDAIDAGKEITITLVDINADPEDPIVFSYLTPNNTFDALNNAIIFSTFTFRGGFYNGYSIALYNDTFDYSAEVYSEGLDPSAKATIYRYGLTQLSNTIDNSETLSATPKAVKTAYDLANGKASITMSSTDPGEGAPLTENNFIAVY